MNACSDGAANAKRRGMASGKRAGSTAGAEPASYREPKGSGHKPLATVDKPVAIGEYPKNIGP